MPLAFASAAFGRMPTAMTTRSAGTSVPSPNLTPRTRSSPKIAAVCAGMTNLSPRSSSERFNIAPADASSCRSINVVHEVHDGDLHAALLQPVRRLEPEQPTADDDCALELARRVDHAIDVRDVAIADDTVKLLARQRQHDRVRARRQNQPIVRHFEAALRR